MVLSNLPVPSLENLATLFNPLRRNAVRQTALFSSVIPPLGNVYT